MQIKTAQATREHDSSCNKHIDLAPINFYLIGLKVNANRGSAWFTRLIVESP